MAWLLCELLRGGTCCELWVVAAGSADVCSASPALHYHGTSRASTAHLQHWHQQQQATMHFKAMSWPAINF